jgi:FdhD protein
MPGDPGANGQTMQQELTIRQYKEGQTKERKDIIAEEQDFRLIIDESTTLTVSLSPDDIKPFTYGFLFTSGLIASVDEVRRFNVNMYDVNVSLARPPGEFNLILSSGCGSGAAPDLEFRKQAFKEVVYPDFDRLPLLYKEFNRYSIVHAETGGVHSAALTDGQNIRFFSEDIGRHNAVDKAIGKALLVGAGPDGYFLLVSGRVSGEIVKKASQARLRAIISRSAPTCAAIKQARKINMGIIGFLRGKRFNIYT